MSDYLWDKKGEPEADVARLETLLGAFAHERRPLEWPTASVVPEPPPTGLLTFWPRLRASRLFAPAALAAAALLVASILAASAYLRARLPAGNERAIAPAPSRTNEAAREAQSVMLTPPGAGHVKDETPASVLKDRDEKGAVENLPRVSHRRSDVQLAAAPRRRPKDLNAEPSSAAASGEGITLEALSTREGASTLVENARLLTKEQLVYALRFTGAKLKDVREKAQGTAKD